LFSKGWNFWNNFFPISEAIHNFAESKITTIGSGSWLEKMLIDQREALKSGVAGGTLGEFGVDDLGDSGGG